MNLLRATGRALVGGYFIANGVKALRDPDALVSAAEPIAQRVVPLAQRSLPEAVSAYIPESPRSIVRLCGVSAIAGGLGMATGIAPRAGGALAASSMAPHIVAADPRGLSEPGARTNFLSKLALAGAALVISQDTRGKPSLFWRAGDSAGRVQRSAVKAIDGAQADAAKVGKRAQKRLRKAAHKAGLDVSSFDGQRFVAQARKKVAPVVSDARRAAQHAQADLPKQLDRLGRQLEAAAEKAQHQAVKAATDVKDALR